MIQLDADAFHQAARGEAKFLALFVDDTAAESSRSSELEERLEQEAQGVWYCGRVRADENPELAKMFGVKEDLPALLIMRDEIVLYCDPIGRVSGEGLASILSQAARLDMHKVHEELEEERRNRVALFERRVCPTARRLR